MTPKTADSSDTDADSTTRTRATDVGDADDLGRRRHRRRCGRRVVELGDTRIAEACTERRCPGHRLRPGHRHVPFELSTGTAATWRMYIGSVLRSRRLKSRAAHVRAMRRILSPRRACNVDCETRFAANRIVTRSCDRVPGSRMSTVSYAPAARQADQRCLDVGRGRLRNADLAASVAFECDDNDATVNRNPRARELLRQRRGR